MTEQNTTDPVLTQWQGYCRDLSRPAAPATQTLADRLLSLVGDIARAEEEALGESLGLVKARHNLQRAEDRVLLRGAEHLTGRNADERAAQLRALTAPERDAVANWEWRRDRAASELRTLQAESSLLRAAARLVEAE